MNLTRINDFIDAWWQDREDRESLDLPDDEVDVLIQAGTITYDGLVYRILSNEVILDLYAKDHRRFLRIKNDLASCLRDNRVGPVHLERSLVSHITQDKVEEFRQKAKDLAGFLYELDDFCVKHYDPDGKRVGVSVFQFDD